MTFIVGRGFAERQILKKWKWLYLLNWVEYFDELLRKYWYWQDLAKEIANCSQWDCQTIFGIGRGFAEVQILKKSETGPIPWTFWYILIQFCIPITTDMI